MSWSIYVTNPIESTEDVDVESIQGQDLEEAKEQANTVLAAAQNIIDSGAIGEGPYRITLGGHANPEHKPQYGWANDTISVAISQA